MIHISDKYSGEIFMFVPCINDN